MNETARTFLFDLLNTPSPTGFETAGQRKWAAYVRPHADAVESDSYGTAWATLHGTAGDDGLGDNELESFSNEVLPESFVAFQTTNFGISVLFSCGYNGFSGFRIPFSSSRPYPSHERDRQNLSLRFTQHPQPDRL